MDKISKLIKLAYFNYTPKHLKSKPILEKRVLKMSHYRKIELLVNKNFKILGDELKTKIFTINDVRNDFAHSLKPLEAIEKEDYKIDGEKINLNDKDKFLNFHDKMLDVQNQLWDILQMLGKPTRKGKVWNDPYPKTKWKEKAKKQESTAERGNNPVP